MGIGPRLLQPNLKSIKVAIAKTNKITRKNYKILFQKKNIKYFFRKKHSNLFQTCFITLKDWTTKAGESSKTAIVHFDQINIFLFAAVNDLVALPIVAGKEGDNPVVDAWFGFGEAHLHQVRTGALRVHG